MTEQPTIFFRLLAEEDKGEALARAIQTVTAGTASGPLVYAVDPESFRQVPGTPFAYWVGEALRRKFVELPPFEGEGRTVKVGLQTSDDFRFVRLWWEAAPERVLDGGNGPYQDIPRFQDWCRQRTFEGKRWVPFAKGGEYSPYYADLHLVVNWERDGAEIRNFGAAGGRLASRPQNVDFYFRPGLTWPRRTNSNFGIRALPAGGVFADKGPAAFLDENELYLALAVMFSRPYQSLLEIWMSRADESSSGTISRSYEVGIVQLLPWISVDPELAGALSACCKTIVLVSRETAETGEVDHAFRMIAVTPPRSLSEGLEQNLRSIETREAAALGDCAFIDRTIAEILGQEPSTTTTLLIVRPADDCDRVASGASFSHRPSYRALPRRSMLAPMCRCSTSFGRHQKSDQASPATSGSRADEFERLYMGSIYDVISRGLAEFGGDREIAMKSYSLSRRLEVLAKCLNMSPDEVARQAKERRLLPSELRADAPSQAMHYALGCSMGRWDVRFGLDPGLAPKLADPFAPLPVCSPGMLVGPDGLPARPGGIVSEEWLRARPDAITLPPEGSVVRPTIRDDEYPLRIAWNGILVDDPEHEDDVVRRVREVPAVLWVDRAEAIEREACELLGIRDLREYFSKPANFFADHLKRYSKSRRQAPIYGPLSTASGSYTLWLYYPRLSSDTLFTAVNRYVEPKIAAVERQAADKEQRLAGTSGREAVRLREQIESDRKLLAELRDFREELLRVAALPYRPNLDDGVIINAAPLHRLFRLPRWAKDTKECWRKLERGDYDWAHLAYTIWPDRVREKCRTDRSLAIAHGLEELYAGPPAGAGAKRGQRRAVEVEEADDDF